MQVFLRIQVLNIYNDFLKPIYLFSPNGYIFNNINIIIMSNIIVTNIIFKIFLFSKFNSLSINNLILYNCTASK